MDARGEKLKGKMHSYYVLYIQVYVATIVDPKANIDGIYGVSICGHGQSNQTWTDFVRKGEEMFGGEWRIEWRNYMKMYFSNFPNGEFLDLEVIKVQEVGGDPGTSNGVSVIGRAKIPVFPTTEEIIFGDQPLYGPFVGEGSQRAAVGSIKLSFKLEEMFM